jgi:hydrogenase/urease accessory protein HupE
LGKDGGVTKEFLMRAIVRALLAILLFCTSADVLAHSGGTSGFASIVVTGNTVRYSLTLLSVPMPSALAEQMRFGRPDVAPTYQPLADAIANKIALRNGDSRCVAGPSQVVPPAARSDSPVVIVDFVCAQPVQVLSIRDDLFDLTGPDYHTIAMIQWTGGSDQFAFATEAREHTTSIGSAGAQATGTRSFFLMGVEHILLGWDHLLFLICLLLLGGSFWGLIRIVTAFTVAHSITLAAAALGVVTLPSRLVESVIALSIAYVAAENIFLRDRAASKRWLVAFVFGLVHGFGFASVLKDAGLPQEGLIWSLLGFNLGVETGQAFVVVITMPLLLWLRSRSWQPRAVAAVSGTVLAIGIGLFVGRAFF